LELLAVTRVALGVGIGLLLTDRLTATERRSLGWTLCVVGGLTTIPLAFKVYGGRAATDHGSAHARTKAPWDAAR
jgi:hypothetical protein